MFNFIIAPDFPPDHFSAWHMLNTQLQRLSGFLIHLQTPSGCREQEELVAEGKAALVYANPFDAPALVRENGYIPLAKPKGQAAQLAAVAPAASAAETAAALPADARILTTGNRCIRAFAAALLPDTAAVQWQEADTASACVRRLAAGEADAALLLLSAFSGLNAATKGSLKILAQSSFTGLGHIVLLHPAFAEQADVLREAFLQLGASPAGKMTLEDLGLAEGFEALSADDAAAIAAWLPAASEPEAGGGQGQPETAAEPETAEGGNHGQPA